MTGEGSSFVLRSRTAGVGGVPISAPSGFTYVPPFTIRRTGSGPASRFTTDYNPLNKRPTPDATVYVGLGGNNNNDGTTYATRVRSLTLGVLMANALITGGATCVRIAVEAGDYKQTNTQARSGQASLNNAGYPDCWITAYVNAPLGSIAVEPYDGASFINNIQDRAALTWTVSSDPNIYTATYTGTSPAYQFADLSLLDGDGFPVGLSPVYAPASAANPTAELNAAWTLAAARSGYSAQSCAGASYVDDSATKKIWVRLRDNRAPDANFKAYGSGFAGMSAAASKTLTIWMKNVRFWGGDTGFRVIANSGSSFKVNCYTDHCAYLFGGSASGALGGFEADGGGGEIINYFDYSRGHANDAFGVAGADLVTQANSFDRAEISCKSFMTGVATVALTINGSTSHNLCRTVRVNSVHIDALDRCLHDISGTLTWDLGVTGSNRRGPSGGTTAACFAVGQSGQSAPFATKWMDACFAADGLNGAAQNPFEAYTGANLKYANMSQTPTAGDGTGTVSTYTP